MDKRKAMIAMSGGVDSSVAAYLMQQAGFECAGAMMHLHNYTAADASSDSVEDARNVAQRLGIPFHLFDATAEFEQKVIQQFVNCYEFGATPNPCIQCNRYLKFDLFLNRAQALGYDTIVTGHYARIRFDESTGRYLLLKASDPGKDQSYVLYCLTQQQLAHTAFPLGEMTKEQARSIAEERGFINARKRDSQDICFIPDGDYVAFMKRYTGKDYAPGDYLDLTGKVVGRHQNAICYTLGQRKGLNLALGAPVYVCAKDMQKNTVTVGPNDALFATTLVGSDWNWIPFPALTQPMRVNARARYNQKEQPATVYPGENGTARVVFDAPQRAMTPGQSIVLYDGDTVVGGGIITEVIK